MIITIIIINKTLFIDFKKIDYLQIQEYEILKYIPYVHSSCVRKRIVVKWLSNNKNNNIFFNLIITLFIDSKK